MSLIIAFIIMIALSIGWLVWFLYKPLKGNDVSLESSNIALGRQKILELQQDLDQGLIDQDQFESAKEEISTTLAVELNQVHDSTGGDSNNTLSIILILILLPVISLGVYEVVAPNDPNMAKKPALERPLSLQESAQKISLHLQENPKDIESWKMLGLAYFEMGQLKASVEAYEKAYQINSEDSRLLIDYASALISSNDNQSTAKPVQFIKKALELDPDAPDALYLAGMFAVSVQDFDLAKSLWNRAMNALPESSPDRELLRSIIAEITSIENSSVQSESVQSAITVNVLFSDKVLSSISDENFIMVYAKAAKGRPMPIAIEKIKLKDFSGQVVLSDQNSIVSSNLLSSHDQVVIVARISQSGLAIKQPGDLQVSSDVVMVSDSPNIDLEIR